MPVCHPDDRGSNPGLILSSLLFYLISLISLWPLPCFTPPVLPHIWGYSKLISPSVDATMELGKQSSFFKIFSITLVQQCKGEMRPEGRRGTQISVKFDFENLLWESGSAESFLCFVFRSFFGERRGFFRLYELLGYYVILWSTSLHASCANHSMFL